MHTYLLFTDSDWFYQVAQRRSVLHSLHRLDGSKPVSLSSSPFSMSLPVCLPHEAFILSSGDRLFNQPHLTSIYSLFYELMKPKQTDEGEEAGETLTCLKNIWDLYGIMESYIGLLTHFLLSI